MFHFEINALEKDMNFFSFFFFFFFFFSFPQLSVNTKADWAL